MHPVLAGAGPFVLHTYTALIDLGILLALAWLYLASPAEGDLSIRWLEAGLVGALGGLILARLLYVAANWPYYATRLADAARIWEGGLAWPGAALGATPAIAMYARARRLPALPIFDALALPALLLSGLAWAACAASACAAGRAVAPGELPAWLAVDWPDHFGVTLPRWPTQAIGVIWSAAAFVGLWLARRHPWPPGARPSLAVALIALGAFALGWTRGDPMPSLGAWRLDSLASSIVFVFSIGFAATSAVLSRRSWSLYE